MSGKLEERANLTARYGFEPGPSGGTGGGPPAGGRTESDRPPRRDWQDLN